MSLYILLDVLALQFDIFDNNYCIIRAEVNKLRHIIIVVDIRLRLRYGYNKRSK